MPIQAQLGLVQCATYIRKPLASSTLMWIGLSGFRDGGGLLIRLVVPGSGVSWKIDIDCTPWAPGVPWWAATTGRSCARNPVSLTRRGELS